MLYCSCRPKIFILKVIVVNETEKLSYVKALIYIALADNTIEAGEVQYLDQIGKVYGLSDSCLDEMKKSILSKKENIEDILLGLTERSTKLMLLYDLIALCYADDNYSLVEKQGMENICNIMGIEDKKLSELEVVMEEQVMLQKKINMILER